MTYIQPVISLVIVLLAAAAFAMKKRPRAAALAVAGGTLLLFFWSWRPTVYLLAKPLESWYEVANQPAQGADVEAIVVLSGGILTPYPSLPEPELEESTYVRTRHAAWLYRNWRQVPVLTSGGILRTIGSKVVISVAMRDVLIASGVPAEQVWVETRSVSTYENAVYSAEMLRERGIRKIALVTEAFHMLRSERCFRKQGLEVVPAPCGFYTAQPLGKWPNLVPGAEAVQRNENCLHEFLGLAWYALSGKI